MTPPSLQMDGDGGVQSSVRIDLEEVDMQDVTGNDVFLIILHENVVLVLVGKEIDDGVFTDRVKFRIEFVTVHNDGNRLLVTIDDRGNLSGIPEFLGGSLPHPFSE
jgi:hypothetical protein